MKFLSFQLFLLLLFAQSVLGQQVSNLQLFNNLTDSVSNKITSVLTDKLTSVSFSASNYNQLNILYDYIKAGLINAGIKVSSDDNYQEKITLTFSEAKVEYDELFKEHLFGKYLMKRKVILAGGFILEKRGQVFDFNYITTDTVDFDGYTKIESKIYPFTEGEPPKEPFFSNLIEPVVAIAATATMVILFFTVRSK